jgi:hypothetical protein
MTEHNINLKRLRIAMKRVYQESLFDIQNGEREENKFLESFQSLKMDYCLNL